MKHQKNGRTLSRNRNQRKALFCTMLGSLVLHEKVKTTEAKAKELKNKIDKVINKAKKIKDGSKKIAAIRDLGKDVPAVAVKKLSGDFIDRFKKRSSGYTRIIKLPRRKTDGARLAIIEFV